MRREDLNEIPKTKEEIRLFCVIRNEFKRLPFFLQFYRNAGVKRFFFIDNASTDASREYLMEERDVHVFYTNDSYGKATCGHQWLSSLLTDYGTQGWCVAVDADEFVRYPFDRYVRLPELCQYLDQNNYQAFYTLLLDMYSAMPIADTQCKSGEDPLGACSYFDTDTHILRSVDPDPFTGSMLKGVYGGVRKRVFGIEPCLSKFNLFRYLPQSELKLGCHVLLRNRIANIEGATLHFKFISEFCQSVMIEAEREEHWRKAIEYKAYAAILRRNPNLNLSYEKSARWISPEQLIDFDLSKSSNDFMAYVTKIRGGSP